MTDIDDGFGHLCHQLPLSFYISVGTNTDEKYHIWYKKSFILGYSKLIFQRTAVKTCNSRPKKELLNDFHSLWKTMWDRLCSINNALFTFCLVENDNSLSKFASTQEYSPKMYLSSSSWTFTSRRSFKYSQIRCRSIFKGILSSITKN